MVHSRQQKSAVDFNQIPFVEAVMEVLPSPPTTGSGGSLTPGRFYFDSTAQTPLIYTTGGWTTLGATKFVIRIGDNIATSFQVNHNLNTRDLSATVRLSDYPYSMVDIDIDFTDPNYISIFSEKPLTTNQLTVVLVG